MTEVIRRLAYEISVRCRDCQFNDDPVRNWLQAEDWIKRIIEGIDPIESLGTMVSEEDYAFLEKGIGVVKCPIN